MPDKKEKGIIKAFSGNNVTKLQIQTILQTDYIQNKCAKTKLMIPNNTSPKIIQRLSLLRKLDEILRKKLAIINAPAGYGKTTLVSTWANIKKQEKDIVWISLSEEDNDMNTFWLTMVLALQDYLDESIADVLKGFREDQYCEPGIAITSIINGIVANNEREYVIILDDYHLIKDTEINHYMKCFISNIPSNAHLVLITRTKPHLSLAKMRIREELLELNEEAIKFNSTEINELYHKLLGREFDEKIIKKVEEGTEGWIIAIKLLAYSLETGQENLEDIINRCGSDIIEYLSEEIIDQLDEEQRMFLYRTSILPVLSGPICNFLLGIDNSQQRLDELIKRHMFIVVLNEESGYYRYQHLFCNFLTNKLKRYYGEEVKGLYLRASKWFEENGDFYDALNLSIKAQDQENNIRLIESCADKIMARGEFKKLINIVEILPADTLEAKPHIYLYYATALAITGQFYDKEDDLKIINPDIYYDRNVEYKGAIWAIRTIATYQEKLADKEKVEKCAKLALDTLSENNHLLLMLKAFCYIHIGFVHGMTGDRPVAQNYLNKALEYGKRADNLYVIVRATYRIAYFKFIEGNLNEALTICESTLLFVSDKNYLMYPSKNILFLCAGLICYELNELDKAFGYIKESLEHSKINHDRERKFQGLLALAKIQYAQSNAAEAAKTLEKMESIYGSMFKENVFIQNLSDIVRLHANVKGADSIVTLAEKYEVKFDSSLNIESEEMNIVAVEVLLQGAEYEEASMIISKMLQNAKADERKYSIIRMLILDSICKQRQGRLQQSIEAMREAVICASGSGYQRVFMEYGDETIEILHELQAKPKKAEDSTKVKAFLSLLLSNGKGDLAEEPNMLQNKANNISLSIRELEVLDCIIEGLTNVEISKKLYISTSTVKKHIKNIYEKLNVNNRTKALKAAKEQGLL